MKVLIIEDNSELQDTIRLFLQKEGFVVEFVSDFQQAIEKIELYNYDCILVDIGIPGGSGLDIVRHLKSQNSQTGIIIISANNSIEDKILGLDLGADDYLPKPFSLAELNARIRAVIRRRQFQGNTHIVANEIEVYPDQRKVLVNHLEIHLTTKEFDLLLFFISNKNRVLSKATIAEHLWGDDADQRDSHDFIYVHLKNLRSKIAVAQGKDYITTVYGIGYKLDLES